MVPDSKVHGAHMEPTWGRHDPGGPHVGPDVLPICGIVAFGISVMVLPRMPYSTTRLLSAPINHSDIADVGFNATYWYTAVGAVHLDNV